MQEIKNLIDTMMDGLKDIKSLYWKAKSAKENKHNTFFDFYCNSAMNRIEEVKEADRVLYGAINEYKKMHGVEQKEEDSYIWQCLYGSYIDSIDNLEKEFRELKMK